MKKLLLGITLFLLTTIQLTYAEILKNYEILGNERVSKRTIINFTNSNIGKDLSLKDLN